MADLSEEQLKKHFSFLLDEGYRYEYLVEKSSDRSGVFIHRFRRGNEFYDFRSVSDGSERTFVVYRNGEYRFPNLPKKHKEIAKAFSRKHFFRKPTIDELWAYAAQLLKAEHAAR